MVLAGLDGCVTALVVEWSVAPQMLNPASPVVPVRRQLVPSVWAMAVIKKDFPVPAVPHMIILSGCASSPLM